MRDFKSYPKEKDEIRDLITKRQHYLNIVNVISCIATFRIVYTYAWFIYGSEVFSNVRSDLITIIENVHVFIQFAIIFLIFMVSYAENSVVVSVAIAFLAFIEMVYSFVKLAECVFFYRPIGDGFCSNPNKFQCYSKYEQLSLIYDVVMVATSLLSGGLALIAFYQHVQLIWIKYDKNSSTKSNIKKLLQNMKKEDLGVSSSVHSSKPDSKQLIEFAQKGDKFEASVSNRKTTCALVNDSADLITLTNESQIQGGSMKSVNKMPFTFRRVLNKINPLGN